MELNKNFSKLYDYIRKDDTLNGDCKILFSYIASLSLKKGYCYAGNAMLAEESGCTTRTIQRRLKKLIDKGLLKSEVMTSQGRYQRKIFINENYVPLIQTSNKDYSRQLSTSNNLYPRQLSTCTHDSCDARPMTAASSYIDNSYINNREREEPSATPPPPSFSCLEGEKKASPPKPKKQAFGERSDVLLTQEEHDKLELMIGKEKVLYYIERLSSYMAQKGKKYHSHYYTLLSWIEEDTAKKASPVIGAPILTHTFGERTMDERTETTKETHANTVKRFVNTHLMITGGSEIIVDKNGLKISYPTSDALHGFKTYHMPLPSSPKEMLKSLAPFQGIAFTCSEKLKDMCM